jgi:hypothetical protein
MRKLVVLCLTVGLAGASNFYIFYKQVGDNPNCPGLSIDAYNNAPSHRKWATDSAGSFSEDNTRGDWLIRAVLDWAPQDTNASVVWFGTNMPTETVPNINFSIRAWVKNMGSAPLPRGTPVRLAISGPGSYTYDDTATTLAVVNHGATSMVSFTPAWHIPDVAGVYNIKVWTEAAGEMWPADDTIAYDLNCVQWIQYHTEANLRWLTWAAPERAVKFNPADFSLDYPVGVSRVRAEFYEHDTIPWPDSSFTFKVYGDNGQTLLYQSETLEAIPGTPGPYVAADLDSMLVIDSGSFYVAVRPVSSTGHPSSCGDSSAGGHSFYGSPGSWRFWPDTSHQGELFISAVAQGSVGLAGSHRRIGRVEDRRYATPDRPVAVRGNAGLASRRRWTGRSGNLHCAIVDRLAAVHGNLGLAGSEQGVVPCENHHYAVLDPSPGVSPFSPALLPNVADTLKYDNGLAVGGWCQDLAGGGWGVKFISPADSVTLAGALVHFYADWPRPGDTLASFRVYADDGVGGAPGTELYAVDSFKITWGEWNFVPLAPVCVEEGLEPVLNSPSLRITSHPNPATDRVAIRWQVPRSMPVTVNLYDAAGRMVRSLLAADDGVEVGTLALKTKSLAAGIYLVRLETAKGSATCKLVIDR